MKKVATVIFYVIIIGITVIGCGFSKSEAEKKRNKVSIANSDFVKLSEAPTTYNVDPGCVWDYTDPDTGVHYLIYNNESGTSGLITVRLNKDGSIMIDK